MSAPSPWKSMPRRLLILPLEGLILAYRLTLSPLIGRQCRYVPTCSMYALDALAGHGPVRGSILAARRLLRCHPLSKGGYDPVPIARIPTASAGECSLNSGQCRVPRGTLSEPERGGIDEPTARGQAT